jgi:hypothetical protein
VTLPLYWPPSSGDCRDIGIAASCEVAPDGTMSIGDFRMQATNGQKTAIRVGLANLVLHNFTIEGFRFPLDLRFTSTDEFSSCQPCRLSLHGMNLTLADSQEYSIAIDASNEGTTARRIDIEESTIRGFRDGMFAHDLNKESGLGIRNLTIACPAGGQDAHTGGISGSVDTDIADSSVIGCSMGVLAGGPRFVLRNSLVQGNVVGVWSQAEDTLIELTSIVDNSQAGLYLHGRQSIVRDALLARNGANPDDPFWADNPPAAIFVERAATITSSCFEGNANWGLYGNAFATLEADDNWWNSTLGPARALPAHMPTGAVGAPGAEVVMALHAPNAWLWAPPKACDLLDSV